MIIRITVLGSMTCSECEVKAPLVPVTIPWPREDGTTIAVEGFPSYRCNGCGTEFHDFATNADLCGLIEAALAKGATGPITVVAEPQGE